MFAASLATPQARASQPAEKAEASAAVSPATPTAVSVARVQGLESFPAADRERLDQRLREGMARSGFNLSEGNAADGNITTKVTKSQGDFEVVAEFERDGKVLFSVRDMCELCGVDELGETLASMGGRLQRRAQRMDDTARLVVNSNPDGAEVRLDGQLVGSTPLDAEVPPGQYELTVYENGYRTESKDISLEPATQAQYSLSLKRTGYKRWLPWTLLGAGAVSLAAGISLVAIDENPIRSDCNQDIDGRCQYLYDTLAGGVTFTVIGAGLVISGATLAILWRRNRKPSSLARRIQPSPHGLAIRF
jgi:hypothetical protein